MAFSTGLRVTATPIIAIAWCHERLHRLDAREGENRGKVLALHVDPIANQWLR